MKTQTGKLSFLNSLEPSKLFAYAIYLFMFLFWLWVSSQAPYTNDDWDWGLPVGMEQLLTASVNSRYSGNLIIVCITRSRVFKTVFCGCLSWALPFVLSRIDSEVSDKDKLFLFVFSNFILLTMSRMIWRQTYGWLSAYANYITSGFCLVVIYIIYKKIISDPELVFSWKRAVPLFIFIVFSMLFIENLTIYFFAVAAAAFILACISKKNVGYCAVIFAAAFVAVPIMFSSPSYAFLFEKGYSIGRSVSIGAGNSLSDSLNAAVRMFNYFLPAIYELNAVSCAFLLAALCGMLRLIVPKKSFFNHAFFICNALLGALLLLNYFGVHLPDFLMRDDGNTHLSGAFLILVSVEMIYIICRSNNRQFSLMQGFLWFSTILIILPLLVTNNSGGRLYFNSILIMLIFTIEFYCYYIKTTPPSPKIFKPLFTCVLVPVLLLSAYTANIYRVIGKIDREQRSIISQAVEAGDSKIYLPAYSPMHETYIFAPMAEGEYRLNFFKQFYNIDPDVEIIYCYE